MSVKTAVLIKLKEKYPEKTKIINELITESQEQLRMLEKTGIIKNELSELINRLSTELKEELIINLFTKIYPAGIISKHPSKRAWLMKISEHKFFYEPEKNEVIMPQGINEPRKFKADEFLMNLPKLSEFINYLSNHSPRLRRSFL